MTCSSAMRVARRSGHARPPCRGCGSRRRLSIFSASSWRSPTRRIARSGCATRFGSSASLAEASRELHLCPDRLPAIAQPADHQRAGGRRQRPRAAAVRVLRAGGLVPVADDRRAGAGSLSTRLSASTASCSRCSIRATTWPTQVVADVAPFMGDKVYETIIPRNVRVSEAPSHGKPVLLYDLKCAGQPSLSEARLGSYPARARLRRPEVDEHPIDRSFMARRTRPRLGRGLAALMGDAGARTGASTAPRGQRRVPIEFLRPNPRNPRKTFDDAGARRSGRTRSASEGVMQPILVRAVPGSPSVYEIIAGERRWRAAQRAGLHEVPVVVIEAERPRSARNRHHRKCPARRSQRSRRSSSATSSSCAEFGYSQNDLACHRQEPKPCRQYACGC